MSRISHFLRVSLLSNFAFKLIAVVLSIVLWWFIAGENQVQVGLVVPLEIRNLPAGALITNKVERQVEVRLSGPPSVLGNLKPDDISASINLSTMRPGRRIVTLDERSIRVPPGLLLTRIYPTAVEVVLERLDRRRLPVVPRIVVPPSIRSRISRIEVDPRTVEVEAPPGAFAQVGSLSTEEIVPENGKGLYTTMARVELWTVHAKIVGNPVVRVRIHFR
ncbi:MAG TPA: CdaR family protein [Candidatus Deferrimicrobiaceae bacterium]|jgi:YbbR domain-containing protein